MNNAKERCRRLAHAGWEKVLDDKITIEEYRNMLRKLGKIRYVIEKGKARELKENRIRGANRMITMYLGGVPIKSFTMEMLFAEHLWIFEQIQGWVLKPATNFPGERGIEDIQEGFRILNMLMNEIRARFDGEVLGDLIQNADQD